MRKGAGKIAKYIISKQLEESNFALIYRVQDKNGKDIVLKVAKDAKPELNELISREFQILSQFQHPNIVSVYDYGMTDGRAYFTQEYIPDKPIQECFSGFSEEFLAAIIQVINALGAFHDKGFIHCDLKPEHILYNKEKKRAALIDFGFAGTPTKDVQMAGTLGYMAPEVLKGVCIDQRSDLYSLGVIIYEILSGKQLKDPYEPIKDIPADVNKLLARLVSKEPLLRPNAPELFQNFKKHITTIEVTEPLHKVNLPETGFVEIPEIAERIAKAKSEALVISGDTGSGKTRHLQELKYKYLMQGYAVLFHTAKEQTTLAQSIQNFIGLEELGLKEIEDKFQIFETINQELLKFAEDKNVAILVDGLEDLSDYALQLFRYIGYGIKDANIVLIGTAQPEQRIKDLGFDILELRPFTKGETKALLEKTFFAIAGNKKTAQEFDFFEWLHKQSGGNPLYIVEILKSLYDQKVLCYKENQWQITSDKLEEIKLPTKLDGLLEARLHTLDERSLKILKILSVADCPLHVAIISEVLKTDTTVYIEHLRNTGLLQEEFIASKKHIKIPNQLQHNIVKKTISTGESRTLSNSLIKALKQTNTDNRGYISVLARLYAAIGKMSDAVVYYENAAGSAEETLDFATACKYYQMIVEYRESTQGQKYYETLWKLGHLYYKLGNNERSIEIYKQILQCSINDLLYNAHLGLGESYAALSEFENASNHFDIAVKLAGANTNRKIDALNQLGFALTCLMKFSSAGEVLEKAAKVSESAEYLAGKAKAEYYLSCLDYCRNNTAQGLARLRELMKICKRKKMSALYAHCASTAGTFCIQKGLVHKAEYYIDIAIAQLYKLRMIEALGVARGNKALILMMKGDLQKAAHIANEDLSLCLQINNVGTRTCNLGNLAAVYESRGWFDEAINLYQQSLEIRPDLPLTICSLVTNYYRKGLFDSAASTLEQKLNDSDEPIYHFTYALVCLPAGAKAKAKRHLEIGSKLIETQRADISTRTEAFLKATQGYYELLQFKISIDFAKKLQSITHPSGREYNIASAFIKFCRYNNGTSSKLDISKEIKRLKEIGCIYDYAYLKKLMVESVMTRGIKNEQLKFVADELNEAHEILASLNAKLEKSRVEKLQAQLFPLLSKEYSQRPISTEYLSTFSNLAELINSHLGDASFVQNLLDVLVQATGVERGALFIKSGRSMKFIAGRNIDQATIDDARKMSKTVVKDIAKNRIIFTQNALSDPKFSSRKSVKINQIRSLLCVPLTISDSVVGALYLDSRIAAGVFKQKDKDFLVTVSKILASVIEKSQAFQHMSNENLVLKTTTVAGIGPGFVIGKSATMHRVYDLAEKVSKTDAPVLLVGETGTGKGMLARYIHVKSKRKSDEFLTINCGAIPETLLESELFGHKKGAFTGAVADKEGLLEAGSGGTVFLDEISNTSLAFQAKLLQAIEERILRRLGETKTREINVRFIFATSNHLEDDIKQKRFRKDLYYRINVITIRIPPLRERKKDIPILAHFFFKRYNTELNKHMKGITPGAMKKLREYSWPGNVRELQNVIERAVVLSLGTHITQLDISLDKQRMKEVIPLNKLQEKAITDALDANNWNITKTAKQLGIGRVTLWRHIKEHNIVRPQDAR